MDVFILVLTFKYLLLFQEGYVMVHYGEDAINFIGNFLVATLLSLIPNIRLSV